MRNATTKQRLRYWFDNLMSKGTTSLLLLLGVITATVAVVGGLAAVALGGPEGTGADSVGGSIWFTLMHALNTGVLAKEEGTVPYLIVMTLVTLVGIFITSFLIGTISNAIKEKIANLQEGRSTVIEEGHVVIIGFDENIINILEELALANENQRDAVVVVMAEHDKTDMEDVIRDRVSDLRGMRVICRSGRPDSPKSLDKCSLDTCKSIIVNLEDDFMTVKTILACRSLLEEQGNRDAYMTAVIRDRDVVHPAFIAGGEVAEVLNFQKTIARLMVQSASHPGMSDILSELLSFKGNEIYVQSVQGSAGLSLGEVNLHLPSSTVIGMVRDGEPLLNPDASEVIQAGDELILIAHDDDRATLQAVAAIPDEGRFQLKPDVRDVPQRLLVLGYSDMLKQILLEVAAHGAPGSQVTIAVEPGRAEDVSLPDEGELGSIVVDVRECKIQKRRVLEGLVAEEPTAILLLADPELSDEEADSRTLMLQLQLNDIADAIGSDVPLIVEMNSTRNQQLAQMMRATDFVVSGRITAKMMVQVAEERHKKAILNDLLSDGGSSIFMKPITRYVQVDHDVDFYTLGASAARYGEIAIGYKRFDKDGAFQVCVNPRSKAAISFGPYDDLIVVAPE
ncbi:MAG: TrkA C-terminal domain-containing protein [Coriobacteriales bacterium]|nr:TrkA C-terminal domain-containing protein [Coriobacteriales bacterium]